MIGWSELIFGSMYCGKSEELIRRLKRARIAGQKIQLFKPSIDDRYGVNQVATHENNEAKNKIEKILDLHIDDLKNKKQLMSELSKQMAGAIEAHPIKDSTELLSYLDFSVDVVGIDEVQFFDEGIVQIVEKLVKMGKRVIMAGLDMYASGNEFPHVGKLACMSKYVNKLRAVCVDCGGEAEYSFNTTDIESNINNKINVGSVGKYVAVCENCRERRLLNNKG